ncbi:hypothetical protein PHYPSEUDO_003252 [Phytophthora pseudosyringae]|uniref:Uncharacterized protein n=1 Tax=Phytophthora pseudosyringae TaxID=221518 RepID=A0A8T1V2I2_9STRA|nr:hypothetical protein PHYPSEUDO_003252 [Phytophthora pseudosyringae]
MSECSLPLPLEKYVLPQFRELLVQGVIDTGDIGKVVARIFLLLAMNATIMNGDPVDDFMLVGGEKRFKGQFCSVKRFLGVLDGSFQTASESEACEKKQAKQKKSKHTDVAGPTVLNVEVEEIQTSKKKKKSAVRQKLKTKANATASRGGASSLG